MFMSEKLKKLKYFYLLVMLGILFGCSEEKEYLQNVQNNYKFRKVPFSELLLDKSFGNAYEKFSNINNSYLISLQLLY